MEHVNIDEHKLNEIYINRLMMNNVPIIYNLRHLRKYLKILKKDQEEFFGTERGSLYRTFTIPKKTGGVRIIEAPNDKLKIRQLWIKVNILDKIHISNCAMGFRTGKSIYNNARQHVEKELIINIDLKDFFPSIKYKDVFRIFVYLGYTRPVSHLLTKLCTNTDNVLPQGAPTSPVISNIVLLKLDKRLEKLAEASDCVYTRYADDITFSGSKTSKSFFPIICKIITEEGFEINEKKIRFQYSYQRQVVTGLTVNKKVSVSKGTIRELENAIYYGGKYGIESHMKEINCSRTFYKEHLYGIAYFIKMIDEEKGLSYLGKLDELIWPY